MKLHRIAMVLALMLGSYGLPSALAQDTQNQTPTDQNTPATTAPADKNAPQPVQQPDDSKVKHDGGKNDVDAIGNRKVGGRGMGNWYSIEGEIRMGKEYAQMVEASSK
ncbi:MAG: hypothetical protein DMG68_15905, partial [Acidobacteria bacterium]